jgi:CheY-like chemotaxis protein
MAWRSFKGKRSLPRRPKVSADRQSAGSSQSGSGSRGHLVFGRQRVALVADDEPLVCQLVCSVLVRSGWRTIEATDGVEALGMSIDEQVDLLITDYEMPSISGLQLANAVRRRTPDVPILMISRYPACSVVARDHGFHFLQKPFSLDELLSVVAILTEHHVKGEGVQSRRESDARGEGTGAR